MFVTTDTTTQGNWKTTYGIDGYSVSGDSAHLPNYAQVKSAGQAAYTWSDATSDARALQRASSGPRVASCWYHSSDFTFEVNCTDGLSHRLALYCLDWGHPLSGADDRSS